MSGPPPFAPADWIGVRLVVFDVDGTLYRQRPLRLRMARDLMIHTLLRRDFETITVLAKYRRIRERLGDRQVEDFAPILLAEAAAAASCPVQRVSAIVEEWINRRPLPYLRHCRYAGLAALFDGLRRNGKSIGVLSDYPAREKLDALGLRADHVVWAGDTDAGMLKPHPRGLQALMKAAGAEPGATLMIGDRADRDGETARRAGARALLRSARPLDGWQTFARFDDAVFAPMIG